MVFSRTLTSVRGNARLASALLADEIAAALDDSDRPVEIGGPALAGQALEAGLVDEFHLFRYPTVLGVGTPYFPPVQQHLELDLVHAETFAERVVVERYRRRG